jgi:PAS domain S-box-containing protein
MTPIASLISELFPNGIFSLPESNQWVMIVLFGIAFGSGGYLRSRSHNLRTYGLLVVVIAAAFVIGIQAAVATDIEGLSFWGMRGEIVEFPLTPIVIAVICLIGALIGPLSAGLVGLAYGLGHFYWHAMPPLEIINFAVVAFFIGVLLRQRIGGTAYNLLRIPLVAAALGAMLHTTLLVTSTTLMEIGRSGFLRALDHALINATERFPVLMVDALLGGLLATLILLLVGRLSNSWTPSISRVGRRLDTNLVTFYLIIAALLVPLTAILTYSFPRQLATLEISSEMAFQSDQVSSSIGQFLDKEKGLLLQASDQVTFDESGNLQSFKPFMPLLTYAGEFEDLFIVVNNFKNAVSLSDSDSNAGLSENEENAAALLLAMNPEEDFNSRVVVSDDDTISFAVRSPDDDKPPTVLVGRLAIDQLQAIAAANSGSLVDSFINVLDHTGGLLVSTAYNDGSQAPLLESAGNPVSVLAVPSFDSPRLLLKVREADEAFLTIESPIQGYPWQVRIAVPEEVMVQESITNAGILAAILFISSLIAAFMLLFVTRSIRKPLTELELATNQLASGNLDYPIKGWSGDEIGRLVHAFREMREAVRRRQQEQRLMVELSQTAFQTLDLETGISQILRAAIQATNASSARFVVSRTGREKRIEFGQGPLSKKAAVLDTNVLNLLADDDSFEFNSREEVASALSLQSSSPVPGSILAIRLQSSGNFDGGMWLAFKDPVRLEASQKQFLDTLMQQMQILLENARIFAMNEAGRQELEAILRSAADAVVVTDTSRRVRLVNEAAERFFGFHGSEIIGQPMDSIPSLSPLADAIEISQAGSGSIEVEVENDLTLAVRVTDLHSRDGNTVGRIAVLHDISRFKASDQAKAELIANISHDLRTPLSYIYNYATLIPTAGDLLPIQEEWLGKIMTGVNRMNELVDNLLDIRRLQSDTGLLITDVWIAPLLEKVVQDWEPVAEANGLELVLHVEDNLPPVKADSEILSRSIRNIVSNTVKYAPNSGLVDISASYLLGNVIVTIKDRGPGISEEDLERVFDEFYRSEVHKNNGVKGTGLGLALVKAAAERVGGRVWCESHEGSGSTFIVSIPANDSMMAGIDEYYLDRSSDDNFSMDLQDPLIG